MKVSAILNSGFNSHEVSVVTDGSGKSISIAPKSDGWGSSVNGAELLMLSIATCFCKDIYREANRRKISVRGVIVTATGDFQAEGKAGTNFRYTAEVKTDLSASEIEELIRHVNKIAEIHQTLRRGIDVKLVGNDHAA